MEGLTRRQLLLLTTAALAIRLCFVLWAPGELSGDALWHYTRAKGLAHGAGYVNLTGNPSIAWMPGWSLLLAGLYVLLGDLPWLGFAANAVLGAATTTMVALLGARLLSAGVGLAAGAVYAVWPGNVYYAATLMSETFFNFALVGCLLLLTLALAPGRERRALWLAGAGAAFGAAAMIKAEPLVLSPMLLLALYLGLRGGSGRPRLFAAFLLAAALVLAPWVVRNYLHFGRIIVTSSTGPANAWLGNHAGASGGQAMPTAIRQSRYLRQHPETSGYRLALEFALAHPREEAEILGKKLVLTYGRDDGAVTLIRGVRGNRYIGPHAERRLRGLANGYWGVVVALALFGLTGLRSWPSLTRVIVLGVPLSWLVVHLVFLGGARFHVPETPAIAICAGAGLVRLRDLSRRALAGRAGDSRER
jgi:4-amino-4-deoxy-L-arabinose transferase-like glycosyltransferase